MRLSYAPMTAGRLTEVRCRIIARYPAHEAKAACTAVFVAPHHKPRPVRVVFDLSGIGVLNPDCSPPGSDPFCR
jgi:hypothetical protein